MSGTVIRLKYSEVSAQPADDALQHAEPAYSYLSGRLWIGKDNGTGTIEPKQIGGEYFTSMLDHTAGFLTASSALIVDSNKHIDEIISGGLTLTTTGGSGQKLTSVVTTLDGSAANTQIATALAIKTYVDDSLVSTGVSDLGDVAISNVSDAQFLVYSATTSQWINRSISGDVTINASGVADITASGVTAGSYGSGTAIPTFTVAADGRITSAGTVDVATTLGVQGDDATTTQVDLLTDTLKILGGTALTTITSSDTITVKLDDTAVTPGSYGSGTAIPTFTVDQQGRITNAGSVSISTSLDIAGDTGTDSVDLLNGTLTFTGGTGIETDVGDDEITITLSSTGVTSGSYGSSTVIPVLTIDAQGRITAASTQTVSTNITVAGDSGSGNINTGSTFTVAGGVGLTSAFSGSTLTVNLDDTAVTPGVYGSAVTIPRITVDQQGRITLAEAININANSFGTIQVTDTDSGFQWAEIGSTVATANAATVKFVSGYGVNLLVDPQADAVKFDNSGVVTLTAGTHLSVDSATGDITISTDATSANTAGTLVSRDGSGNFSANKIFLNEIEVDGVSISTGIISSTGTDQNITFSPNGDGIVEVTSGLEVGGDVAITGNLTVSGTTTSINVTQLEIADPIIHIASGNTSSDAMDFGFTGHYSQDSGTTSLHAGLIRHAANGEWYLFKDYVNAGLDDSVNTIDPTDPTFGRATLHADILGNIQGNADTATALETSRQISISGDVAGSVFFDGTQNVDIAVTIQPNSVQLGTDTTGNYVATLTSALGGLIITNSGAEDAAVNIELDTSDSLFVEGVQDAAAELFTNGVHSNVNITYDDANNRINVSVPVATTSVKGVASFSPDNFAVTAGVVTITVIDGGTF